MRCRTSGINRSPSNCAICDSSDATRYDRSESGGARAITSGLHCVATHSVRRGARQANNWLGYSNCSVDCITTTL
jgi:hypothetical protein